MRFRQNELDAFVHRIATNIAALPEGVIAAAKKAIPPADLSEDFLREHKAWAGLFARPAAEKLIRGGLQAGAQTKVGEQDLEQLLRDLFCILRSCCCLIFCSSLFLRFLRSRNTVTDFIKTNTVYAIER
ncbi:hypothetical protein ABVN80_02575 [Acinetobacter baumannii]